MTLKLAAFGSSLRAASGRRGQGSPRGPRLPRRVDEELAVGSAGSSSLTGPGSIAPLDASGRRLLRPILVLVD